MNKTLVQIEKYTLITLAALLPVLVLPIFANAFITPKLILLAVGVCFVLMVKAIRTITSGSLELFISKYDFPLIVMGGAYLAAALLRTPNRMEAFFLPGTATIILAVILYYFLANQMAEKERKNLETAIFASGIVTALVSLLALSGIFSKIPYMPELFKLNSFNTTGSNLGTAMFLATILPLGVGFSVIEKDFARKTFWTIATVIVTLGLAVNIFHLLPGKESSMITVSHGTSWEIAVDSLKISPFLGVGPGNYPTAFNRFLPLAYNQTDFWAVRFNSASNYYLTLLTEAGLLGAAGIILLGFVIFKTLQKSVKESMMVGWGLSTSARIVSLVIIAASLAFYPATPTLLFVLFLLISLNAPTKKLTLNLSAQTVDTGNSKMVAGVASRLPAILVTLPVIIAVLVFSFHGARAVRAEATFKKSLDAFAQDDALKTYDLMALAIQQNQMVDRYHASFAQVNFALANALAQQEDLSDEDRLNISQFIQQAINEGKATVALNPGRAGNWEILAQIYQSIMGFAEGADQFAIETFNQAVALDPTNPNLRIALGGVYFSLGAYDEAIETFRLAVMTKPDLANSHYNLAIAYREKGDVQKAIAELTAVLSLIDRNSEDYNLVKTEIETLEKKLPATAEQQQPGSIESDVLTPPQGAQGPVIEPPLQLPAGAEPPTPPSPGDEEQQPVEQPQP